MSVTATEPLTITSIDSRNADTVAVDAAGWPLSWRAEIKAAVEREEQKKQTAARSRYLGTVCARCGCTILPRDPLWIINFSAGGHQAAICEPCAHERSRSPFTKWQTPGECDACHRPVTYETSGRERRHAFCCLRCQQGYYNRLAVERNRTPGGKLCPICGQQFEASRRDAVTCSPACRQKAYRRRGAEARRP
jgi:hypothetical protein